MEGLDDSYRREYLLAHASAAEEKILGLLADHFPNQEVVAFAAFPAGHVTAYLPKSSVAILVEDEAHDHSDGYYRHLAFMEQLRKEVKTVLAFSQRQVMENEAGILSKLSTLF